MAGWKNSPRNFGLKCLKDADTLTKKITGDMLQQVITKSPVDTGAFRGNHRVGVGKVDTTNNVNETENNALSKGIAIINSSGGLGKIVYISNSLPYSVRLENGHSQGQAPHGVYAISFMNVVNKYK